MTGPEVVAIVGSGQVGTTLGMALRDAGEEVVLADRDPGALEESLAREAGDRAVELEEVPEASTVILAVPVPEIVSLVRDLAPRLREETLFLDTGGTKVPVVRAMREHVPPGVHAIGGHPMAGTEVPGPSGASPERLRHATFALTPVREDPIALLRATRLAEAIGTRPRVVEAEVHDRVVARTSHLPHLAAFALAGVAGGVEGAGDLAASGFADTARLAGSDPAMVAGVLTSNAGEVRGAVAELRAALDRLAGALEDPGTLRELLAAAGAAREELLR